MGLRCVRDRVNDNASTRTCKHPHSHPLSSSPCPHSTVRASSPWLSHLMGARCTPHHETPASRGECVCVCVCCVWSPVFLSHDPPAASSAAGVSGSVLWMFTGTLTQQNTQVGLARWPAGEQQPHPPGQPAGPHRLGERRGGAGLRPAAVLLQRQDRARVARRERWVFGVCVCASSASPSAFCLSLLPVHTSCSLLSLTTAIRSCL